MTDESETEREAPVTGREPGSESPLAPQTVTESGVTEAGSAMEVVPTSEEQQEGRAEALEEEEEVELSPKGRRSRTPTPTPLEGPPLPPVSHHA